MMRKKGNIELARIRMKAGGRKGEGGRRPTAPQWRQAIGELRRFEPQSMSHDNGDAPRIAMSPSVEASSLKVARGRGKEGPVSKGDTDPILPMSWVRRELGSLPSGPPRKL
jgi:hypothetical protein